ncbi:Thiol-disulfide oxidoreductase ResA [termite gut metagenome]|uniref:Thiol-disulfide oxidoreductase ResA n=1 Tax=termite gut metagenome TaxID=433724 RepID=A0A5J4RQL3_9ZZZZ
MRNVKRIFVVLILLSSLTFFVSFEKKDKPARGLNVGSAAPDFEIKAADEQSLTLSNFKGRYVLLSFWASYDAQSRIQNICLSNAIQSAFPNVEMVSVSFDEYRSVFTETIRKDQIVAAVCFVETTGMKSGLFEKYRLKQGFISYLLDKDGIILAKDVSIEQLDALLNNELLASSGKKIGS